MIHQIIKKMNLVIRMIMMMKMMTKLMMKMHHYLTMKLVNTFQVMLISIITLKMRIDQIH